MNKLAIIILSIIILGCSKTSYSHKPTLYEKQKMYHSANKPLRSIDIYKYAFWVPTMFIFSFMYISTIKNN